MIGPAGWGVFAVAAAVFGSLVLGLILALRALRTSVRRERIEAYLRDELDRPG